MDNSSSNTRQDRVAQASEFFIEFRAGDGTPTVRARFEKWLRSSPENVQAYLEIAAGWSELPTADPEGLIDIDALLGTLREWKDDNVVRIPLRQPDVPRAARVNRARLWALAACLALVTLAGTAIWVISQSGRTYGTGIGEQRTLILADGSTVTLNALTTVVVHMTKEFREVTLVRGQAYFHDTDEPTRPFIVRAGKSSVRAIGTEFDVDLEADRTVVTVLTGQVAVAESFARVDEIERRELLRELAGPANKLEAVLVSAGEQVTVLTQNLPTPNEVDVTGVTAWMQQRLVFDDTPLSKVAEQFNLYSKRPLVIADPSLRGVGVSGEYSASDPAALIGFLRSQPTLRVVEKDDQFVVTRP
jgi:transmembrane sensor